MKYDKALGTLLAAAIGDAMGTPLESRPIYRIKQDIGNGGFVFDYKDMPADSYAPDLPRGSISDDFSVSYAAAEAFVNNGGKITRDAAIAGMKEWCYGERFKVYSANFMGPTTRVGMAKLEGTYEPTWVDDMDCDQKTITNGAAMKSWVAGLFNPGNVDKAIDDAITMCLITHDNVIALSAACAVAAGVARALVDGATVDAVVEAGIYGAHEGYLRASDVAKDAAGASVEKRIRFAVELGLKYSNDFETCITEMTDLIGTGLHANEAVPAAFGFLVASGGDVMQTVYHAINAGNDCDTVAEIAGALAGALKGSAGIPPEHLGFLSEVHGIDIAAMAKSISELV